MRLKEIMEFQRTLDHDPWLDEPMNEEERQACEDADASAPLPPKDLVDALQDRIHPPSGRLLAAKPVNQNQVREHEIRLKAQRALERLSIADSVEMREQIVETAEAAGMLSIWLDVFEDDEDMRRRIQMLWVCVTGLEKLKDGWGDE